MRPKLRVRIVRKPRGRTSEALIVWHLDQRFRRDRPRLAAPGRRRHEGAVMRICARSQAAGPASSSSSLVMLVAWTVGDR